MLWASLRYFNVDQDVRSVLVASHGAEVGKSTGVVSDAFPLLREVGGVIVRIEKTTRDAAEHLPAHGRGPGMAIDVQGFRHRR